VCDDPCWNHCLNLTVLRQARPRIRSLALLKNSDSGFREGSRAMFRSKQVLAIFFTFTAILCGGSQRARGQSSANPIPPLPAVTESAPIGPPAQPAAASIAPPVAAEMRNEGSHFFHHEHQHVPACPTCVPATSTTKSTSYNYESRPTVICYKRAQCSCLRCLFHLHGHHAECAPTVVPVVKRVLVKYKVTEEKTETKYEGKLSPRPPQPVADRPSCALHGPSCLGHHSAPSSGSK